MTTDDTDTGADTADAPIEAVEFYWRHGCGFCMSLHRKLERHGIPMDKRNIWEDPAAAAFVRSVADGNETVPTLRVGSRSLVNPSLDELVEALRAEAPHLVPDGYEPAPPTAVSRLFDRILGD